jgi:hypothetical protein
LIGGKKKKQTENDIGLFQCRLLSNAHETGGGQYKLPGAGRPETGPGAEYVAYVLVCLDLIIICRLYILILFDQTQVTLQLTVSPI